MELKIEEIIEQHKEDSQPYIDMVQKWTSMHTDKLDSIVAEVNDLLNKDDYEIDNRDLQVLYLKLSTELYCVSDKLKNFEIYSSFAKMCETEQYNTQYITNSVSADKKPTVAELQIKAQMGSHKESLINIISSSAYKSIKGKVDSGNMIADTLKNILKSRSTIEYTAGYSQSLNM